MQLGYDAAQLLAQEYRNMTSKRRIARIAELEQLLAENPAPGFQQVSMSLQCLCTNAFLPLFVLYHPQICCQCCVVHAIHGLRQCCCILGIKLCSFIIISLVASWTSVLQYISSFTCHWTMGHNMTCCAVRKILLATHLCLRHKEFSTASKPFQVEPAPDFVGLVKFDLWVMPDGWQGGLLYTLFALLSFTCG